MTQTHLVTERTTRQTLTGVRECSSVRAPIRALAEYLESLEFPVTTGGIHQKLKVVRDRMAQPEELAEYPGASILLEGGAQYGSEDGGLQPMSDPEGLLPDGNTIFIVGEVQASLSVRVWTNEDEDREDAIILLEDALNPLDWMSGFWLEMPHYCGLRATFQMMEVGYEDGESDNMRRYRKANFRVKVVSPVARLLKFPGIRPRAVVDVSQDPV